MLIPITASLIVAIAVLVAEETRFQRWAGGKKMTDETFSGSPKMFLENIMYVGLFSIWIVLIYRLCVCSIRTQLGLTFDWDYWQNLMIQIDRSSTDKMPLCYFSTFLRACCCMFSWLKVFAPPVLQLTAFIYLFFWKCPEIFDKRRWEMQRGNVKVRSWFFCPYVPCCESLIFHLY